MSEPFIAQIIAFPFNFTPRNWSSCQGQILPISQNAALFSIIGTMYGGDGRSTMSLPDFRDRIALSVGRGNGLSHRQIGQFGGELTHSLISNEIPSHTHDLYLEYGPDADKNNISDHYLSSSFNQYNDKFTEGKSLNGVGSSNGTGESGTSGASAPHNNEMPYLTLNYCISLFGAYPTRN